MAKIGRAGFFSYLIPYWKLVLLTMSLGVVSVLLGIINPYFAKLTIDNAYGNRDIKLFILLASVGAAFFLIGNLLDFVKSDRSRLLSRKVNFDISRDLFKRLQDLPFAYHADRSSGEYVYRLRNDTESVSALLSDQIPRFPVLLFRFLAIVAVIFYLNWKLALFALMLVPISHIQSTLILRWIGNIARSKMAKIQKLFKNLHETFSHMHLIKSFGREKNEIKKFEAGLKDVMEAELKDARMTGVFNVSGAILSKALSGVVVLFGGFQVIRGEMTLGSLTAIAIYVAQMMGLLKSIYDFYQNIVVGRVAEKRIGEILETEPSICDSPGAADHIIETGSVEFRDVSFGYRKDASVIDGISFLVEPYSKAAFVGLSGSGKTTMISLISRLYEPGEGGIYIDGVDIKKIKLASLKSQTSIALQQSYLWNDTIANNILYGAGGSTRQDMIEAAKLAEAHEFIIRSRDGYDSNVGEAGHSLSEGQKQRIAIARAFISKPRLLVLDEAMSSLDSETEDKIIDNIKREFKDSTVIIVSHRLSTVEKMDMVYFLKDSSTMESGTHEELVRKNLRYGELFASQFKDTLSEEPAVFQ